MTAVSQWEREAIGERTRDALNHKKANGERVRFAKAPLVIFGVKCHYCQHSYPPSDVTQHINKVNICLKCMEWHKDALLFLAGNIPKGCQVCEKTFTTIAKSTPGDDTPVRLIVKDGIYQILCTDCCEPYKRKVKHLYEGTRHAWEQKL